MLDNLLQTLRFSKMSNELNSNVFGQVNKTKAETKICYKWVVNNFTSIDVVEGEPILSPVFSTWINNIESKWQLRFYPKGLSDPLQTAIFIKHLNDMSVDASICFTVVKLNNDIHKTLMGQHKFTETKKSYGLTNFIKQDFLTNEPSGVLINDALTIICEIAVETSSSSAAQIEASESSLRLQQDLEKLFNNEETSDVIFKLIDGDLYAHKILLSARSTYFAAMFQDNISEKKFSIIEISDTSYDVFKEVLKFIYVGKVDKIEEMAAELLTSGTKYGIDGLINSCENSISSTLTVENVFPYLTLANAQNAVNLKAKIIEFITEHAKDIIDTEQYKLYEQTYPLECCEILRHFVYKKARLN